jgi:hypothetical protein
MPNFITDSFLFCPGLPLPFFSSSAIVRCKFPNQGSCGKSTVPFLARLFRSLVSQAMLGVMNHWRPIERETEKALAFNFARKS